MLVGASPVSSVAMFGAASVCGVYLACTLAASLIVAIRSGTKLLPILPCVFFCFHIGYGYGFLRGLFDFVIWRRAPITRMSVITR